MYKIDEVRQAQEEMREMASGLRKKNAVLRNELRHLKHAHEEDANYDTRGGVTKRYLKLEG